MKQIVVLAVALFLAAGAQAATGHHAAKAQGKSKAASHHVVKKPSAKTAKMGKKGDAQKHAASKGARKSGHKRV